MIDRHNPTADIRPIPKPLSHYVAVMVIAPLVGLAVGQITMKAAGHYIATEIRADRMIGGSK